MSSSIPSFDKLNSNNYNTWSGDMEAWYHAQALWRIISSASKAPTVSIPAKEGEEDKLEAWQVKADKDAGIMWLMVEQAQRVHFRGIKDDAVKMWGVLEGVHMQKQPGTRFNAYDDLFSIRKHDGEDLQLLINRVDDAIHRIHDLQSIGFTLDKLDDELASMTLIRALPEDYNSFVSPSYSRTTWTRLWYKMCLYMRITIANDAWTIPLLLATSSHLTTCLHFLWQLWPFPRCLQAICSC